MHDDCTEDTMVPHKSQSPETVLKNSLRNNHIPKKSLRGSDILKSPPVSINGNITDAYTIIKNDGIIPKIIVANVDSPAYSDIEMKATPKFRIQMDNDDVDVKNPPSVSKSLSRLKAPVAVPIQKKRDHSPINVKCLSRCESPPAETPKSSQYKYRLESPPSTRLQYSSRVYSSRNPNSSLPNSRSSVGSSRPVSRTRFLSPVKKNIMCPDSPSPKSRLKPLEVNPPGKVTNAKDNRPNYSSMSEQEQENYRVEFIGNFRKLNRHFPDMDFRIPDPETDLDVQHSIYERYIHDVLVHKNISNYQSYMVMFFFSIEIGLKACGLHYMEGFAKSQIAIMNKYDTILSELGEFDMIGGMSEWPPLVRLIILSLFNAVCFLVINLVAQYMEISDDTKMYIYNGIIGMGTNKNSENNRSGIPDPPESDDSGIMGYIAPFAQFLGIGGANNNNLSTKTNLMAKAGDFISGQVGSKKSAQPSKKNAKKDPPGMDVEF